MSFVPEHITILKSLPEGSKVYKRLYERSFEREGEGSRLVEKDYDPIESGTKIKDIIDLYQQEKIICKFNGNPLPFDYFDITSDGIIFMQKFAPIKL